MNELPGLGTRMLSPGLAMTPMHMSRAHEQPEQMMTSSEVMLFQPSPMWSAIACLDCWYPEEGAYPLNSPDSKESLTAFKATSGAFKFLKIVGSPGFRNIDENLDWIVDQSAYTDFSSVHFLTNRQRDHLFLRIRLNVHRLQDGPNGIKSVFAIVWHSHVPSGGCGHGSSRVVLDLVFHSRICHELLSKIVVFAWVVCLRMINRIEPPLDFYRQERRVRAILRGACQKEKGGRMKGSNLCLQ